MSLYGTFLYGAAVYGADGGAGDRTFGTLAFGDFTFGGPTLVSAADTGTATGIDAASVQVVTLISRADTGITAGADAASVRPVTLISRADTGTATGVSAASVQAVTIAPAVVATAAVGLYPDTSVGPGITDLLISRPGWGDVRTITAFDPTMSWEVSGVGTLSADVTVADAWAIGADPLDRLRGMWVRHRHPTWGDWAGVVTDAVPSAVDGLVEIGARSWLELGEKLLLPKVHRPPGGAPGAVVAWAVRTVALEGNVVFERLNIDELGDDITPELRGETLAGVVTGTASGSGQEWSDGTPKRMAARGDRELRWSDRIGRDLSRAVELVANVHVVDGRLPMSLAPVENALYVTPSDERYAVARGFWVLDPASIAAVGRREGSRAYAGAVTRSTLRPIARSELARSVTRGQTARVDLVDEDGCFAWFDVGDTVRVTLPSADMAVSLRVQAASLSPASGILTISGTWT
ncbi:hypothetical protein [Nocardioides sp.]|uniref:hypothetical protein n=1 Tax=Nocardioides sp. TaxID=35761 RepID=UPI002BDA8A1F|nr:hypothetical protein [Nocardioides sp.]HXH79511.1 hypothetical protein [Nocardioides sp.]